MANCQVLGVLTECEEGPRLSYLNERLAVTDEVLAMAAPAKPTKVFRFAPPAKKASARTLMGTIASLRRDRSNYAGGSELATAVHRARQLPLVPASGWQCVFAVSPSLYVEQLSD